MKRFLMWIVQAIIGLVFVLGSAVLLAEWLGGCGEHYIDAKGVTHINECLFFPKH